MKTPPCGLLLGPQVEPLPWTPTHSFHSTLVRPRLPWGPWGWGCARHLQWVAPVVGSEVGCQGHGALSPPGAPWCAEGAGALGGRRQAEGPGLVILLVWTDSASAHDAADTVSPPCPPTPHLTHGEHWGGRGGLGPSSRSNVVRAGSRDPLPSWPSRRCGKNRDAAACGVLRRSPGPHRHGPHGSPLTGRFAGACQPLCPAGATLKERHEARGLGRPSG